MARQPEISLSPKNQSLPPSSPPYGPPISLHLARQVAARAEAVALANGWKMCIAVLDSSGHLVVFHKMNDVHYASIQVAQAKALTAVNFKRSTKIFEDAISAGGPGLRLLSIEGLCPLEGGIPLLQDGALIGAIGVSGVQSTEDGQVAQAGASAVQPSSGAISSA
jgi:glc operon protein GlcG